MYSCLFFVTCFLSTVFLTSSVQNEFFEDPMRIIRENGYTSEKYTVQTEDGYLLSLYRISHGIQSSKANTRPILLNHGLSASAGGFIALNPKRSIGYILADHGYDVWLVTVRGAMFSDRHISIKESDKRRFYDFTWHEIGLYDIPACIDFILEKTGQTQIQYLGHSQGGTAFLVMGALRPEYNSKISLATLIATPALMDHCNPGMRTFALVLDLVIAALDLLNIHDIPFTHFIRYQLHTICTSNKYLDGCAALYDLIGGYPHHAQLDVEIFNNVFRTLPSNFAIRQYFHYIQSIQSGRFRPFDYGKEANFVRYGTVDPPDYNLSMISVPVSMIFARNDHLAHIADSRYLVKNLPNIVSYKIVKDACWNHGDMIFGIDAMHFVFTDMLKVMSMY